MSVSKHYRGFLGEFEYFPDEFEIVLRNLDGTSTAYETLHYIGKDSCPKIPLGLVRGDYLFYGIDFPNDFTNGAGLHIDGLTSTCHMFERAKNINFEIDIDMSIVTNACSLFSYASFGADGKFSNRFDTEKTSNMKNIFYYAEFPVGFSLGDYFYLSRTNITDGFSHVDFPLGFKFGKNFKPIDSVLTGLFSYSTLPIDFKLPNGFILGDWSYTDMYKGTSLPTNEMSNNDNPKDISNWLRTRNIENKSMQGTAEGTSLLAGLSSINPFKSPIVKLKRSGSILSDLYGSVDISKIGKAKNLIEGWDVKNDPYFMSELGKLIDISKYDLVYCDACLLFEPNVISNLVTIEEEEFDTYCSNSSKEKSISIVFNKDLKTSFSTRLTQRYLMGYLIKACPGNKVSSHEYHEIDIKKVSFRYFSKEISGSSVLRVTMLNDEPVFNVVGGKNRNAVLSGDKVNEFLSTILFKVTNKPITEAFILLGEDMVLSRALVYDNNLKEGEVIVTVY